MGFFVSFIVALAFAVVGELLRPKMKPSNAKPSSLDDFSVPTAEEGRIIPVICGKVKVDGPNVTWYGDLELVPVTKKIKTGWFSSATSTIAWKYMMGMQMFLCHSRDDLEVHEIRFGDKQPIVTRTDEANGVIKFDFNDNEFFGGDEKEGGISGTLRFYRGHTGQGHNAYWASQIGVDPAPAYEGCAYAMLEHLYLGTSAYIKPVGYILSSYPNTLAGASAYHKIGDDANPVCFIYEIINSTIWGLNVNAGRFNLSSWVAAAQMVYNEGYGISMIVNTGSSADELIEEILRHIDGVIYTDPATGLLDIKLARADYDIGTIPEFTDDDFVTAPKFSRPSWSETKNTIKVSYVDRAADFTEKVVSQQDLANIQQREGEIDTEMVPFMGFSTWLPANLACARALKTMAYPLAKMSAAFNRRAWNLRPGSVIKVTWTPLGIIGVVFRVVRIDYGSIRDNKIELELIEDIFAISQSAYIEPPPTGWVDPVQKPSVALTRSALFELPAEFTGSYAAHVGTLASRDNGIDEGYEIWSSLASGDGSKTYKRKTSQFTPSAVTTADYIAGTPPRDATGFAVSAVKHGAQIPAAVTEEELLAGDSIWLIRSSAGDEYVAAKNFTGSQIADVIRGVYGTTPLTHPAGATVWYISGGFGVENVTPYTGLPVTVYAKLLNYNVRGVLPLALGSQRSVVVTGRAAKPYPVRYLRVNGVPDPAGAIVGDANITWEFVDPMTSGGRITVAGSGSSPLAPGNTFSLTVHVGGVLKRTITGLTVPYYNYTEEQQVEDGIGSVVITVWVVRTDGTTSQTSPTVAISGTTSAVAEEYVLDGGGA
jgi:hypothetical protein